MSAEKEEKMADESKSLTDLAGHDTTFLPDPETNPNAHVKDMKQYKAMYQRSIEDPEGFWTDIAKEFFWKSWYPGEFMKHNFDSRKGRVSVEFMKGATTNICYNVLDRIVTEKDMGDAVAFFW